MFAAHYASVIFCLVVITADCFMVFGRIFLNSRYRHDDDLGQISHAVSHQYTRRQLLALRFDEHCGRVRQCTFDLVTQLGCYGIEAVELVAVYASESVKAGQWRHRLAMFINSNVYRWSSEMILPYNAFVCVHLNERLFQYSASHFLKQFTARYLMQDRSTINMSRS